MRMMRVSECCKALDASESSIRYMIRNGLLPSARIGGVACVDYDVVSKMLPEYKSRHSYPGNLVTQQALMDATGLSRYQIMQGIDDGWIKPVTVLRRKLYDLPAVERALEKMLGGGRA